MELLKDYDYPILYYPGKANVAANALSRKSVGSLAHIGRNEIDNKRATFTSAFWQELHKARRTRLDLSTNVHSQTDGQSKRTIHTLEDVLQMYIIDFGSQWDSHLPLIEFAYNNNYQESIKMTPYEALYRRKCRNPLCWEIGERPLTGPELMQITSEKASSKVHWIFLDSIESW